MARILITRAPHQASELSDRLRALGHDPILIPAIEFAEPTSFDALDAALTHLESFHWTLFTSANAVHSFKARAEKALKALQEQIKQSNSGLKNAVIGATTARALTSIGLIPDLIPPHALAESLAESLLPHALQPDGSATRMLLIRAELARNELPETLRSAGADVTIAPAYRTIIPSSSIPLMQDLFKTLENYPGAITFTSSSTATNLLALLEVSGLSLPPQIPRISIGPITSKTLHDLGFPPHAEAAEPTLPSMVEAITSLLSERPVQD
jgi:uroporphyrinogen-III synthase